MVNMQISLPAPQLLTASASGFQLARRAADGKPKRKDPSSMRTSSRHNYTTLETL